MGSVLVLAGAAGLALGAPVGFGVVQVAIGLASGWFARGYESARTYLVAGGLVYLGAFLALGRQSSAVSPVANTACNWVHLGWALLAVVLGLVLGRHPRPVVRLPR